MSSDGNSTVESTYTAVNVRRNGVWYVDSVRETDLPTSPAPAANFDGLKDLSWMIGEWSNQEGDATVEAKCKWSKNKSFITRQFSIWIKDELEVSGIQVIAYDASVGKIKSWMSDSDGGVAEGIWSRKGNTWSVQTSAVMSDGSKGSAVHALDREFTWQSVSRELDGEILPNIKAVKVVRVTGQ